MLRRKESRARKERRGKESPSHTLQGLGAAPWQEQEGPAPPSPAIIVLPHGAGAHPSVQIEDVDSPGRALEIRGSPGAVPAAGAPKLLAVPGAASPRYGHCPPPRLPGQGQLHSLVETLIASRFGCAEGVTPVSSRGDGKSLASCLRFSIKLLYFV